MGDTLADLTVKLNADFGDVQGQFDSLMDQLSSLNARSAEGKTAIANLSDEFEKVLPPIDSMKSAAAGAAVSVEDFMTALEKDIDSKFGDTIQQSATASWEFGDAERAAATAADEFNDSLDGLNGQFVAEEEMTKAQKQALEDLKEEYRAAELESMGFGDRAQEIIIGQEKLEEDIRLTAEALREIYQGFEDGKVGAEVLAAAQEELAKATAHVKPELEEENEALKEMGMELLQLAGLVFTAEKIKELGEESVIAYGKEQQLATSMELMGAGAEGAAEKVEELKDLSQQLAVPFEQLSSKARELTAVFGTGESLNAVLIAAGNAAAATGRSFGAVASSIERVEMTGAVAGRQLMALGLSWKDLAETMGTSIAEAQEKLKKGGQSAAEDVQVVLDTVERKFGEAAEKQAENTLGKITILKNRIEFIMAGLGENFADVVNGIQVAVQLVAHALTGFVEYISIDVDAVIGLVQVAIAGLLGLARVSADLIRGDLGGALADAALAQNSIKDLMAQTAANIIVEQQKAAKMFESIWGETAKKVKGEFDKIDDDPGKKEKGDKFKTKNLHDYSDAMKTLIAQSQLYVSAAKAMTEEAARFNEKMGTGITTAEYLAIKTALVGEAFNATKDKIGEAIPKLENGYFGLAKSITQVGKEIDALGAEVDKTNVEMLANSPFGKMAEAAAYFGITTTKDLEETAANSKIAFDKMKNSGVATARDLSIAFLKMEDAQNEAAFASGRISREQYAETARSIKEGLNNLTGAAESSSKKMAKSLEQVVNVVTRDLTHALTNLVTHTGKVGDSFKKLGMDVAGIFEKQIVNAITKMVAKWIEELILGKAEQSAVDVGNVTGQAAFAGAAGFASVMAAIPFPFNVALAPEVAAATSAAVEAAYVPMASFDLGGRVPQDMPAMLHGGEHVLTDDLTQGLERVVAAGGLAGEGGIKIDMSGATFNGVTKNLIDDIGNQIAYKIRQVAGNKKRF